MGSSLCIDGLVCNDFSPQARLAAALKKKLESVGTPDAKRSTGITPPPEQAEKQQASTQKYSNAKSAKPGGPLRKQELK